MEDTNVLTVTGKVDSVELSHFFTNPHSQERIEFYKVVVAVARLSENYDYVPVIVPGKLMFHNQIKIGDYITINGDVRTRNYTDADKGISHLSVYGFATDFKIVSEEEYEAATEKNSVRLEGFICKKPTLRNTTSGRIISDLSIAHNRKSYDGIHCKSDYIPCVTWGVSAKAASRLCVGEKILVEGRFQSRKYSRKNSNDLTDHMAYEVSVTNFSVVKDESVMVKHEDEQADIA